MRFWRAALRAAYKGMASVCGPCGGPGFSYDGGLFWACAEGGGLGGVDGPAGLENSLPRQGIFCPGACAGGQTGTGVRLRA